MTQPLGEIHRALAREHPVEADLVIATPESGTPAAIGYAQESGIPFELGIIRNHYVGRTFIQPGDKVRHLGVKLKHNANRALIEGKRIVLVDGVVAGAINRLPGEGEIRSNLAVGGSAEKTSLTDREREICAVLGPELKRRGLVFVGIDVIAGYLTEINVTSPTGIVEGRVEASR